MERNRDQVAQSVAMDLQQMIGAYYPDWTDYDESDPSISLMELFAYSIDDVYHSKKGSDGEALVSILEAQGVLKREDIVKRMKEGKHSGVKIFPLN